MSPRSALRRSCRSVGRAVAAYRSDRRGNIALLFGLLLLPLIGTTGLAIDYGQLLTARTTCQTAADAAALYASGVAKALIQQSDGSAASVASAKTEAQTRATGLFNAHVARMTNVIATGGTVTVAKVGQRIDALATFNVATRTSFGGIFGVRSMNASGSAKSSASMPLYTDLYMALDVSQSMGLASTTAGAKSLFTLIKTMERNAGNSGATGCVFGCHVVQTGSRLASSYQSIAGSAVPPITLRIDVLRNAVNKTISTAQSDALAAGTSNYRIALYTTGLSSANGTTYSLNQLAALSSNWNSLSAAAANIDLGPNNGGGTGDSYLKEPLTDLLTKIPTSGDGTSQATSRAYVIIITDGLRDVKGSSCTSGHCTAAFDPTVCQSYKNKNITVGVIYTTYLPILADPTTGSSALDGNYQSLVQPYVSQIAPNLQACSSPGWYAEASDGPSIDAALAKMFGQTTMQPQITN